MHKFFCDHFDTRCHAHFTFLNGCNVVLQVYCIHFHVFEDEALLFNLLREINLSHLFIIDLCIYLNLESLKLMLLIIVLFEGGLVLDIDKLIEIVKERLRNLTHSRGWVAANVDVAALKLKHAILHLTHLFT